MSSRVLIIESDARTGESLVAGLTPHGFAATSRSAPEEALALLAAESFDAVVTSLDGAGIEGIELCRRCVSIRPDVPVIVITAFGTLETAVAAIRAGAYDFLTKPFELGALAIALDRAAQHRALRVEVTRLRRAVAESRHFEEIVGASSAMKKVYELLDRAAETDATVLLTGETGTGKELAARALHARSSRRAARFVAVNCAAMPEPLLESELFGHAKGAFTDARSARPGLLLHANQGTLLLDEIGEMSLTMQVKLLRALQERTVRPVGGDGEVPFDVRIVAATSRDLETSMSNGQFREDLFYRLDVIQVGLPPLRARGGDVLLLAQHFLEHHTALASKKVVGLGDGVAEMLLAFPWPGNVRELQNCIERAVALTAHDRVAVEDLPEKVRCYERSHVLVASDDPSELVSMDEVERRYILRVLEAVRDNKTLAAQVLGLDRKTLYRKLERYRSDSGRWLLNKVNGDAERAPHAEPTPPHSAARGETPRSGPERHSLDSPVEEPAPVATRLAPGGDRVSAS